MLLITAALAIRLLNLMEISDSPHFAHHQLDSQVYHQLALTIAEKGLPDTHFTMSPLFSMILGGNYALWGVNPYSIRILYIFLGVLTVILTLFSGFHLGGKATGWLAGGISCFYEPYVFYEGILMPATILVLLTALSLYTMLRLLEALNPWRAILPGLILGLAALGRGNYLILAVGSMVMIFLMRQHSLKRRAASAGLLALTAFLVILPVTLFNYHKRGDFILINTTGGMNFYLGNNNKAIGTFQIPKYLPRAGSPLSQVRLFHHHAEKALGKKLSPSQADKYWYGKTFSEIGERPFRWLGLLARKTALYWNSFEVPSVRNYYYGRIFSKVRRLPLFEFWFIGPLALLGLVLALGSKRARRRFIPAFWFLGLMMAATVGFFILARYRLLAVPLIIIFAAYALSRLGHMGLNRKWRALTFSFLGLIAAALLTNIRIIEKDFEQARWRHALALHKLGKEKLAAKLYLEQLRAHPNHLGAHQNLAVICDNNGLPRRALMYWRKVLRLAKQTGHRKALGIARKRISHLTGSRPGPRKPGQHGPRKPGQMQPGPRKPGQHGSTNQPHQ